MFLRTPGNSNKVHSPGKVASTKKVNDKEGLPGKDSRTKISEEDIELLVKLQLTSDNNSAVDTKQNVMGMMMQKSLLRGHSQTHMVAWAENLTRAKSDSLSCYDQDASDEKPHLMGKSQQDLRARNTNLEVAENNPREPQSCQFNYKKDKMRFYQGQKQQYGRKDKILLRGNSQPQLALKSYPVDEKTSVFKGNQSYQNGIIKKNVVPGSSSPGQLRTWHKRDQSKGIREDNSQHLHQEKLSANMWQHERDLMRTMSENKIETGIGGCLPRQRDYTRVGGRTDTWGSDQEIKSQESRSEQGLNYSPERLGIQTVRNWVGHWRE